ncbi:MAG: penicillin-binding protein activator LpoB [Elusimicrobiota bacterium]
MKRTYLVIFGALILLSLGCAKKIERVDVEKQIDLSGRWNDTDSQLVSRQMVSDCLSHSWIDNYSLKEGEKPTVIVGTVVNKTDEHIISETFTKDLERAFINSGKVHLVASKAERKEVRQEREEMQEHASDESVKEFMQEEAADFMLKGVVNSIRDKEARKSVIFYQIDLELINTETNQKVWIGDKKIKKYIKS